MLRSSRSCRDCPAWLAFGSEFIIPAGSGRSEHTLNRSLGMLPADQATSMELPQCTMVHLHFSHCKPNARSIKRQVVGTQLSPPSSTRLVTAWSAHAVAPVMSEAAPGALSGEAPAADDLKPLRLSSKKQPDVPSLNSAVEAALSSSRPGTASREVTFSAGMTNPGNVHSRWHHGGYHAGRHASRACL